MHESEKHLSHLVDELTTLQEREQEVREEIIELIITQKFFHFIKIDWTALRRRLGTR
jgi:hypothetical protein